MKKIFFTILAAFFSIAASAGQWTPVGNNIRSQWAAEVEPSSVLPEYPRPQMVRAEWQNLNGLWNYAITDAGADTFVPEGTILVPFPVESSLSGVGKRITKENALWYEREFTVPKQWKGRNIKLNFGAVDWKAEVYVNGNYVGMHTGGYDPFSFDITPYLKKSGRQVLRVKVQDATDNGFQPRGKQIHASRGIWYTPVSGIWQTVWIEPVSMSHIENYYAVSDIDNAAVTVHVAAKTSEGDVVKVALLDGGIGYSPEKPSAAILAEAVVENGKVVFNVADVKTWSPDSPYLYGLKVYVENKGKVVDSIEGYTAMRKISIVEDNSMNRYRRIALNDVALFQFGPLDQGWWPDGLYTAPTDEALRFDIEKTKEMGFNMIRKHIKVEPARWYYWCDVLGMIVWQDMPCIGDYCRDLAAYRDPEVADAQMNSWSGDSLFGGTECNIPQEWKDNYYKEWTAIMDALKGFQCIAVWVPFNEGWGQFDTEAVTKFTKQYDPTRLVNEASGGNFKLCGDILDVHHYPCPAMNVFERKMVNVLGEYGGIGYPVEGHLWQEGGNWGYGGVKGSMDDVLRQYDCYADMLKVFVSTGCAAAIYTQTTDVEGEVNGLMTYDRAVIKVDEEKIAEINREVIGSMPSNIEKK